MENKNTIVALVLMLLVWSGFTYLFPPNTVDTISDDVSISDTVSNVAATEVQQSFSNNSENIVGVMKPVVSTLPVVEKTFVVENDKFIATFSTVGGRIISLQLKDYRIANDLDSDLVSVIDITNQVPSTAMISTGNLSIHDKLVYDVENVDDIIVTGSESLQFRALTSSGLLVTKIYKFKSDSYDIKYEVFLENTSTMPLTGSVQVSLHSFWNDEMEGNRLEFVGPVSFSNDELSTDDVDDIAEQSVYYTNLVQWSGFENKYFISAIIVPDNNDLVKLTVSKGNGKIINSFDFSPINLSSYQTQSYDFTLYYGPKDVTILKSVGSNLSEAIDFGFFKILAKPLHIVLNFFYKYVGNYGVAIILLTVILKLIFWPLTQKSYVSMKAMQTLQPEMKKLREKFSNDKEGLNKKMMELYKEHRVNPLGGCLPMFVQIPVFFALYKVLLDTIELRHAPFIFWLTDLSIKDPYYITPLVMGLTMFIQQKLTPSTMDPMQAKMMMAMPVVFTFMFLNFPAGLVIYWLVNNLLTIFQQYLIYKKPA